MTSWIRVQTPCLDPDNLGPLQLAWLGDAVWEMHHRLKYCSTPRRSKDLHELVVAEVKARSQADALAEIEPYLFDNEKEMVRRGRNKAKRGPKNSEASVYAKATGFETMIGWLFLKNPDRLAHLLDCLNEIEPNNTVTLKK